MIRCTAPTAVSGSVQRLRIFFSSTGGGAPGTALPLATCSIITITRLAAATRSIAPPIPLIILPGIIQLARSPVSATCIAPRIAQSMWPPRIMAKDSADEK